MERYGNAVRDLVATVGHADVKPGAGNVVPGFVALKPRCAPFRQDAARRAAVRNLLQCAEEIASRRKLQVSSELRLDQSAVAMDVPLTDALARRASKAAGCAFHNINSQRAGHDAMILARRGAHRDAYSCLRSPGGVSHHPDEAVLVDDVATALAVGVQFLEELERGVDRNEDA